MHLKKPGWVLLLALAMAGCRREVIPEIPEKDPEGDIPVLAPIAKLIVNTENGAAVDSKDPADYRRCTLTVDWAYDSAIVKDVSAQIRGRGNSTWEWYPKKPYRIKLDEASIMLGLPKNRDWVLLADYRDVTHMMNATGFYLARELGLPHSNHIRYVTLVLNGKNMGLYALTEQVEEGGNRVKLDGKEGILLALDINDGPGDAPRASDNFWSEVFGMACAVKYPEDATRTIAKQVKAEFAQLEKAIEDEDWEAIQELLDVESMVNYILVQEIIGNVEMDNYPSMRSGFIHRYDDDAKWVMGPVWDCDGGFSYNWGDMFDSRGWGHTFFGDSSYLVFGSDPYYHVGAYGSTASPFFCRLFGIPEFVKLLQTRWKETHSDLLDGLLEYLDQVEEIIGEEAQRDMNLWGIKNYKHQAEVRKLKTWLVDRFKHLNDVIPKYPVR